MTLRVLSLGAGVQSTTLALMAAVGELPMPDCAIFADTQAEPGAVYDHLRWLERVLPFPVHRVTAGSLRADLMRGTNTGARDRFASIPYFLDRLAQGVTDKGMGRRQCTREYKVDPITKKQRQLLGFGPKDVIPVGSCEVWLGISVDEAHRMKPARSAWQINRYPLIEAGMSRSDCLAWLKRNAYPIPTKSACAFCPYRSDHSWMQMKATDPAAWQMAVEVDRGLRLAQHELALDAVPYVHASLRPLDQVDFSRIDPARQPDLFGNECEGLCGV